MAALDALAATTATADMDVELAEDGSAGDFGLVLPGHLCLADLRAAVRASIRQGRLVGFIDLGGVGRQAVAVAAVSSTAFAAGLFRLGLGRPLGEGRGLTLGLAAYLVQFDASLGQLALQAFVVLAEPFVVLAELLVLPNKAFNEVAQVVQLSEEGDRDGHGVADLDGRRQVHGCLKTTGYLAFYFANPWPARQGALIKYRKPRLTTLVIRLAFEEARIICRASQEAR
jgi:hypothetical protein